MKKKLNLTSTPIIQLLKQIAIPSMTGSLFQTLFNLVDTFYISLIGNKELEVNKDGNRWRKLWTTPEWGPTICVSFDVKILSWTEKWALRVSQFYNLS